MAVSIGSLKYKVTADISDYSEKMARLKALRNSATGEEKKRLDLEIKALKSAQKQEQRILKQRQKSYTDFVNSVRSSMKWFSIGFGTLLAGGIVELRNMEQETRNLNSVLYELGMNANNFDFDFGDLADQINEITGASQQSSLDLMALGLKWGVSKEQIGDYGKAIMAIAEQTGRSAQQIQRQLHEAFNTGNYDSLRKIGITIEENTSKQTALNQVISQGLETYNALDEKTKGTLTRNIDSLKNDAGAIFEEIGKGINTYVIDPFTKFVNYIKGDVIGSIEWVFNSVQNLATTVTSVIIGGILLISQKARDMFKGISTVVYENVTKSIDTTIEAWRKSREEVKRLKEEIISTQEEINELTNNIATEEERINARLEAQKRIRENIRLLEEKKASLLSEGYTRDSEVIRRLNKKIAKKRLELALDDAYTKQSQKQVELSKQQLDNKNKSINANKTLLKQTSFWSEQWNKIKVSAKALPVFLWQSVVAMGAMVLKTVAWGVAMGIATAGISTLVGLIVSLISRCEFVTGLLSKIGVEIDSNTDKQKEQNQAIDEKTNSLKEEKGIYEQERDLLVEIQEEQIKFNETRNNTTRNSYQALLQEREKYKEIRDELRSINHQLYVNKKVQESLKGQGIHEIGHFMKEGLELLKQQKEVTEKIKNQWSVVYDLQKKINDESKKANERVLKAENDILQTEREQEESLLTSNELLDKRTNEYIEILEVVDDIKQKLSETKTNTEEYVYLSNQLADALTKQNDIQKDINKLSNEQAQTLKKEREEQEKKTQALAKENAEKRRNYNLQVRMAELAIRGNESAVKNIEYAQRVKEVQAQYNVSVEEAIRLVDLLNEKQNVKNDDKSPTGRKLSKAEQRRKRKAQKMLEEDDALEGMSDKERRAQGKRVKLSKSRREKLEREARGEFTDKDRLRKPNAKEIENLNQMTTANNAVAKGATPTTSTSMANNANQQVPNTNGTNNNDLSTISNILNEIKESITSFTSDFKSAFA